MSRLIVLRKTIADLSNPKLLAACAVPFLGVSMFLALGMTSNELADQEYTLAELEAIVSSTFVGMAFFLAVGVPFLALVAVFCANTLAKEAEQGTLRILLSKPVRRWSIYTWTTLAIVTYATLIGLASLLLTALMIVEFGDVAGAAISEGIFASMPGNVLFGAFGAMFVTTIGLALAVMTQNRLQTALGALVVPALYFIYFPVRIFASGMYEDYYLWIFDVGYHFGNAYVLIHEAVGNEFAAQSQEMIGIWGGVYDLEGIDGDELPASLEPTGHLPMEASVFLLVGIAALAFAFGLRRFQRMDV